jgi:N-methylhydantoinase B
LLRPIRITAPRGSLANPIFPAPTIARFCPGNAVADTVMKALAQALPGQVSAGIGNLKVIAFSGMRPGESGGRHWVHMEIFEGSYGGRSGLDGMDAVDTLYANTRNNPIEDIESHLPLRQPLRIARGSQRRRRVARRARLGARVRISRPGWRLGRGRGACLRAVGARGRRYRAGERFVCVGPAGGGYGDPLARDPARVREDVADGFVSVEAAKRDYGVALTATGIVDEAATKRLRREMRAILND